MNWQIFSDAESVAAEAAKYILACATRAISQQESFSVALSGGRTPQLMNRQLARMKADWKYWHIFYADERCLPPDSDERNSRMTMTTWLDHIAFPAAQHHPIPAERGAGQAAALYASELADFLPLDLVVLGMGEDGHTASLFPGHSYNPDAVVVAVNNSPKPPSQRVSLSVETINSAHERLVLVTGADKASAVTSWYNGVALPITMATHHGATVFLDQAAATGISP